MEWLQDTVFHLGREPVTAGALVLYAATLGMVILLAWGLRRLLVDRLTTLDVADRRTTGRIVQYAVLVFGFLASLGHLGIDTSRPLLPSTSFHVSILGLAVLAFLVLGVLFGARVMRNLMERTILSHTSLAPGARYAVARITYYGILVVGILAALQTAGLQLSSLTVALGALSVGIGFGLQNIVNNFVSGLILLFERPIQVGDWVEVEGTSGRITNIGARSITVITNDNVAILIPNATCISNQMINWSFGDPKVRVRLPVGVAYGSDLEHVVQVLLEVARQTQGVLDQPEPMVLFEAFGDSSLQLELGVWVDIRTIALRRFRSRLNFAIYEAFGREGIQIPFPQRDLHFKGGTVRVASTAEPAT